MTQSDADARLKQALEQLGQNEAAVAEAINEARADRSRDQPPLSGDELLAHIDQLAEQRSLDSQDAAILCHWPDAASIGQAWFALKHPGKNVPSPMLVLDAYLVGAPPFLSKAQRDQVGDWYRSKVSANSEYTEAVTGAAKAFVLIGDLNASAAGMAWQTIIPDLLEQGHDLESTSPRNRSPLLRPAGSLPWRTPSRHHRWTERSSHGSAAGVR